MPDDVSGNAGDPNSPVYLEEGISLETVAKLRGTQHCTFSIASWL